jgi:hypothetical protein
MPSSTAPYERTAAPSTSGASAAASGAGLLQPPHAQATSSAVWTPLPANISGGLYPVFAAAPTGAASLPGQSARRVLLHSTSTNRSSRPSGWSTVTGGAAYGGQGALQFSAVNFNQQQWMQLGPAVAAGVRCCRCHLRIFCVV